MATTLTSQPSCYGSTRHIPCDGLQDTNCRVVMRWRRQTAVGLWASRRNEGFERLSAVLIFVLSRPGLGAAIADFAGAGRQALVGYCGSSEARRRLGRWRWTPERGRKQPAFPGCWARRPKKPVDNGPIGQRCRFMRARTSFYTFSAKQAQRRPAAQSLSAPEAAHDLLYLMQ